MKIKCDALDLEVQNKLNRLDNLDDKIGFVYVNNGKYDIKKIDSINARTIYTTDDIIKIRSHKYNSCDNYISGKDKILTLTSDARATKKLLHNAEFSSLFKTQYKFIKYFDLDDKIGTVNASGILHVLNINDLSHVAINILDILKNKFIFRQLYPSDILDICKFNDSFLISIRNNGIYKFNLDSECELFSTEQNVDILKILNNNIVLCCRKNTYNNAIFFLDNAGRKILTFNTLAIEQKYILDVIVLNNYFYIIADTKTALHTNKMLYKFELDDACISYHDVSDRISFNRINSKYQYVKTIAYSNDLYMLFVVDSKICIWYYNSEFNSYEIHETDVVVDIDNIRDFGVVDNVLTVATNNKILQFKNFNIDTVVANKNNILDCIIINNVLYLSDGLMLYKYGSYNYKDYSILTFDLTDINNVNNADVYISANKKLSYKFYDAITKIEIIPAYGMYVNETDVIFKLLNINNNIRVQVSNLDINSEIHDLIIHVNQLYLK